MGRGRRCDGSNRGWRDDCETRTLQGDGVRFGASSHPIVVPSPPFSRPLPSPPPLHYSFKDRPTNRGRTATLVFYLCLLRYFLFVPDGVHCCVALSPPLSFTPASPLASQLFFPTSFHTTPPPITLLSPPPPISRFVQNPDACSTMALSRPSLRLCVRVCVVCCAFRFSYFFLAFGFSYVV